MAAAYVSVYLETGGKEYHVRTFGGNRSEVRQVAAQYEAMTKSQFLMRHPRFAAVCADDFNLTVPVMSSR